MRQPRTSPFGSTPWRTSYALLDLESLSIEDAVGHLCAVEQRKKLTPAKETSRCLLLTEEEWMAHTKSCGGSRSNPGAPHSGGAGAANNKGKGDKQNMGGGKKTEAGCAMTYVGIVVRRANGPENVARKIEMKRPKPTWPMVKKKSKGCYWPMKSFSISRWRQPLLYRLLCTALFTSMNSRCSLIWGHRRKATTDVGSSTSVL
jgi:hypothetical protein